MEARSGTNAKKVDSFYEFLFFIESGLHSNFEAVACRLPPSPVKEGFMEGCRFPVHKYKHTILQRYLNDAIQHAHANRQTLFSGHVTNREQDRSTLGRSKVNSFSGSTSSHDLERMSPVPSEGKQFSSPPPNPPYAFNMVKKALMKSPISKTN